MKSQDVFSDREIDTARRAQRFWTLDDINNRDGQVDAITFALLTKGFSTDDLTRHMYSWRVFSHEAAGHPKPNRKWYGVHETAVDGEFLYEAFGSARFHSSIERGLPAMLEIGGVGEFLSTMDYLERRRFVKATPEVGRKLGSMMGTLFGNTNIMTLDVHCLRILKKLGRPVPENQIVAENTERGGRRRTPSQTQYEAHEEWMREYICDDPRMHTPDGEPDLHLATVLLYTLSRNAELVQALPIDNLWNVPYGPNGVPAPEYERKPFAARPYPPKPVRDKRKAERNRDGPDRREKRRDEKKQAKAEAAKAQTSLF